MNFFLLFNFLLIKFIFFIYFILVLTNKNLYKIRLAIYTYGLKGGGTERATSLLLNYLNNYDNFYLYVFSQKQRQIDEFKIPDNIKRVYIEEKYSTVQLKKQLKIKRIDILIYQFPHGDEIKKLNTLKNIKIIIYSHFCFLTWIYFYDIHYFNELYSSYKDSKYIISLVPFENDYIFKKWGINSILMENLVTYEYDNTIPSNLSTKNVLMVGRASDRFKRFELGIQAMKYISKVVKDCEMKIISEVKKIARLQNIISNLELTEKVKFVGYTYKLEEYFHNASLHIFPTVSEAFPMVLCETKVFGIPNILTGVDFAAMSKRGTIIIYDDNPETIAKESIKILNNFVYRKKLGKNARESMKKYKNDIIIEKWVKLIKAVYKGEQSYNNLIIDNRTISTKGNKKITERQVKLINMREPLLRNLTIENLLNFSCMKKIMGSL